LEYLGLYMAVHIFFLLLTNSDIIWAPVRFWFKHILFLQIYTQHIQVHIQLDWVETLSCTFFMKSVDVDVLCEFNIFSTFILNLVQWVVYIYL